MVCGFKFWFRSIFILFVGGFFIQKIQLAHSTTGVGVVRQYVPGTLSIYKVSDMDFGLAAPGAAQLRLANVNSETPENASFRIQGEPGSTVTITLPPGSIFLSHPTSGDQLEVNRFRSRPNGTARIQATGQRLLYVSAQRLAIPLGVEPGVYTGTFVVDVVY